MTNLILLFLAIVLFIGGVSYERMFSSKNVPAKLIQKVTLIKPTVPMSSSSLAIETMRQKSYPGSTITFEQTLTPHANYTSYLVSYRSDGLKIYGLLTVPIGKKTTGGWPVILFNHGYIPPAAYTTDTSYSVMVDALASAGYIVFKPDYRGNGNSEGIPTQPYVTPDYVTDSMNALSAIKHYKNTNPHKIGVFGHSMGGNITLHELVLTHDLKAAELIAGVVGNATDLVQWWNHRIATNSIVGNDIQTLDIIEQMVKDHGMPASDPTYWKTIDPTQFLNFVNVPVQIQVGTADNQVPISFSTSLRDSLRHAGKIVDYHEYSGADHNLVPDTASVMTTTIAFFNTYLK